MNQLWIFGLFALVMVGVLIAAAAAAAKRRRRLFELAVHLGFAFEPQPHPVHERYDGFDPFGRGRGRRSSNLLCGRRGGIAFELFDYRYTTGSGKSRKTHRHGIVAAQLPLLFRHLVIRPEGVFDKLAAFAGFDDINFESHEFSARYHVWCEDRQFAYKLIHPRAIELLLRCAPHHWQLRGGIIVIHRRSQFDARELEQVVQMIETFVDLVPPFLREEIGHAGATAHG